VNTEGIMVAEDSIRAITVKCDQCFTSCEVNINPLLQTSVSTIKSMHIELPLQPITILHFMHFPRWLFVWNIINIAMAFHLHYKSMENFAGIIVVNKEM